MLRPGIGLLLSASIALAGCDSIPWLGSDNKTPLPGVRKPVLLASEGPAADPRIANLAVIVPPATSMPSWPMPGGTLTHALGNLEGPSRLQPLPAVSIGTGGRDRPVMSPPVVAEGKLFAVDGKGTVTALATGDGNRIWSTPLHESPPDRLSGGGAAYDNGRIFTALAHGDVVALSAADGQEIWRAPLRAPLRAAPIVAQGKVLVRSADNQLFALDEGSGDVLWRHTGLFEQAGILGGGPAAVTQGVVIVAYSSGEVFALLLDSGRQIWSDTVARPRRISALDTIIDITAAPVVDGDRVYVAGAGGEMAAFDLARGNRQWEADITSLNTPWIAGDFLYVVTERGELVCLLRQGGRVRWVTQIAAALNDEDLDPETIWSGPALVAGRLIVAGSSGDVLAFSATTGELLERARVDNGVHLQPIVANGTIFVVTDKGDVVAFR